MSIAGEWIRGHLGAAPPKLLHAMEMAVEGTDDSPLPEALARGAALLYQAVLDRPGGREEALELLAADALFTHCYQAMAEIEPAGLAAFASRWGGPDGIGGLLQ